MHEEPLTVRELPAYRVAHAIISNHITLYHLAWESVAALLGCSVGEMYVQLVQQQAHPAVLALAINGTLEAWMREAPAQAFPVELEPWPAVEVSNDWEVLWRSLDTVLREYTVEQGLTGWQSLRIFLRLMCDAWLPICPELADEGSAARQQRLETVVESWRHHVRSRANHAQS